MPVGYSVDTAHEAFSPPIARRAIERALKSGELVAHRVGVRPVILTSDLDGWIRSQPNYRTRSTSK